MKSLHASLSYPLFALLLGACAATPERVESPQSFQLRREQSESTAQRLRPGMTQEEIHRELGVDVGNCSGSPGAIEVCELTFWTEASGPSSMLGLPASDYSRNEYTTYKLTFERRRLKGWERSTDSVFHGEEQPRH